MKKKLIIAVSVIVVLAAAVSFICLYQRRPFKNLTANDLEAVVVLQYWVADDDSYTLSSEKTEELLSIINKIKIHIFPSNAPKVMGGRLDKFKLMMKDGSVYSIGTLYMTERHSYFLIGEKHYIIDSDDIGLIEALEKLHKDVEINPYLSEADD